MESKNLVPDQVMQDALLSNPHLTPRDTRIIAERLGKWASNAGAVQLAVQVKHLLGAERNVPLTVAAFWKLVQLRGLPPLQVVEDMVYVLCSFSYPRLASDIVDWYEKESPRKLNTQSWLHILNSASELHWVCHPNFLFILIMILQV
jgi:hypothetical protein